jgi:hypothetical protein
MHIWLVGNNRTTVQELTLILRGGLQAASRRMGGIGIGASWFETREDALLTMRGESCDGGEEIV